MGLRRRRPGPGRDDLEDRDLGEEGHRPRHPRDRRGRPADRRRGREGHQAVLRRPGPDRGQELRRQVHRVRPGQAGPGRPGPVKLALYKRRALAKDLGVPADGTGSHRVVLGGTADAFADPDGFAWEAAAPPAPVPS
ncbi:glyoxalase [Kitasatospora sp. Ki12]